MIFFLEYYHKSMKLGDIVTIIKTNEKAKIIFLSYDNAHVALLGGPYEIYKVYVYKLDELAISNDV